MQVSTPVQQALTQALTQFSGNLPTFIAVILAWINTNARISDLNGKMDSRMNDLNAKITSENLATREIIRGEIRRVEEVMDARLKHLEEREH